MITKEVEHYIKQEGLLDVNDKVLVALSGGADSVALLRLLLSLGYTCEAAHCNFHLRGKESDRDEAFVEELCRQHQITLHRIHFDTTGFAAEHGISIEMAARELRYNWFNELVATKNMNKIAVAHHRDDSIETLLLNLIRGAGLNGLLGIKPINGMVVRPLLCIGRKEIIDYLNEIEQPYVTDSTNLQDEYTRNKIRLNLIPLMEEINPSLKERLTTTMRHLNDAALICKQHLEEAKKRIWSEKGILIGALLQEPAPETVLFDLVHPLGFNSAQIEDILRSLHGQVGKQFLSKEWRIIRDREYLLVESIDQMKSSDVPPFELSRKEVNYSTDFIIPRQSTVACFDADKLTGELSIRRYHPGDWFIPFGMKGKKRVSDYLTDRKFSIRDKENQWVLCCGDAIIWLIGERTDNRFRIDETTQHVVIYEIKE